MNKRRNARKLICWTLLLLVTLFALPGTAENAPVTGPSEQSQESGSTVDATVEAIVSEIETIRAQLSTVDQQLAALQPTVGSVWEQKALLDQQIALLASEVEALDRLLAHYDTRIDDHEAGLHALQTAYDAEFQALAVRLRQSYEEGMPGLLEYFGRSDSLLSLLVGLERRDEIEAYDRALMEALNDRRKEITAHNTALIQLRADRYRVAATLAARTQYLNTKLQVGGSFLQSLTEDADRFSYYIQLSQAGIQTADRQIAEAIEVLAESLDNGQLLAELADRRAQLGDTLRQKMEAGALQKGADYFEDGCTYLWPLSLTPDRKGEIASSMGYRTYQVGSKVIGDYHGGVDLAADHQTDVVAAASGKVADVGYTEGYGYYVAILHADGSVTRYAHLGNVAVQAGDLLLQGETLGSAGCSGNSSGVGCHFELWIDGARVEPEAYLTLPEAGLSEAGLSEAGLSEAGLPATAE